MSYAPKVTGEPYKYQIPNPKSTRLPGYPSSDGRRHGHLAVVTQTGSAASVTESAGQIWAELARRYGPWLVLLEHHPAPEAGEGGETLDLVRIGADGSPHWLGVWPAAGDNPRHAGLELWMAVHGHQITGKPANWSGSYQDQEG